MRLSATRLIVFVGFVTSSMLLPLAQDSRVIILKTGEDELQRTAYRLRMCPEVLAGARQALAQAVALYPELAGEVWPGDLGFILTRANGQRAEPILTDLLGHLSEEAAKATDVNAYQQMSSSAQLLTSQLSQTNPELAGDFLENWPDFRGQTPEGATVQRVMEEVVNARFRSLTGRNPFEAMERLPEFEGEKVNLQLRSDLVQHLIATGAEEEAAQLVDESIAASLDTGVNPDVPWPLAQFFSTVAYAFPDRLPGMIARLESLMQGLPEGNNQEIASGDVKATVTGRENLLLSIGRSIGNRPELVGQLLNRAPGLREKLEPFGGIDGFLAGKRYVRKNPTPRPTISERRSGRVSEETLARLEQPDSDPQAFYELIDAARSLCERDYEKADSLLERAADVVAKKQNDQAVDSFNSLISACLDCRGSLTPGIQEQGRAIVNGLRAAADAAQNTPGDPSQPPQNIAFLKDRADQLEINLIAAKAVEDFDETMDQVAKLSDRKLQFRTYVQIAQQLMR